MENRDRLLREADIIRIVDKHTRTDGRLDNDISCILEEIKEPWIKCTKGQMPEDMSCYKNKKLIDVIVTTANGKVTKVQRGNHRDEWYWRRIYGEAKAWMPLPDAYKGEKE